MFQFFLGSQLFRETIIVAPLSRQVYGIGGQTNTPSDPPLHVDHGDANYLGTYGRCGFSTVAHLF